MPFISNAERERRIDKLQRKNSGRKFIIFLTIILFTVFTVLIILSLIFSATLGGGWWSIIDESKTSSKSIQLTIFGWIMFSVACVAVGFGLFSIIILFTMKSAKKVYEEASDLASTPLSGRRTTRKTAKEARSRLTAPTATKTVK